MATGVDSEGHVTLSLSADQSLAADIVFPERRIILNRDKHSVTVGRASKVSSKGFIAAIENAWFESAVMSRLHAQIIADMDKKRVEVKDLGSLHGTFLNGDEPVPRKGFREVKDGDMLQFGLPIWRGADRFAPITLKVGIRFSDGGDTLGTSTFQVPDGSDDEDDEDSSDSDRDVTKPNGHIPAPASNSAGNAVGVVDLTGTYNGRSGHSGPVNKVIRASEAHDIIDLSSPPTSPIRIDDEEDGPMSDIELHDDKVENITDGGLRSSPASPRLDGPRVQEDPDDMAAHMDNDVRGFCPFQDRLPLPTNEEEVALNNDANDTDSDSVDTESDIDYPDEDMDDELMSDDNDDARSECDQDMEVESEGEYSSDDDNLSMDSIDDGFDLWGQLPQFPLTVDYPEIAMVVDSLSDPVIPAAAAQSNDTAAKTTAPVRIEGLLNEYKPQSPVPAPQKEADMPTQEVPAADSQRDASPSKSFYTVPSYSPPTKTTVETLGVRTGKVDFFVAREENKMTINAQRSTKARPASSVHALCNEEEPTNYSFGPAGGSATKDPAEAPNLPRIFDKLAEDSGVAHSPIVSPPLEPSSEQTDSCIALADLPSTIGSTVNPDGDAGCGSRRTHVGIADIVNSCQQTPETRQTKRKAQDISDTTEEQELWAIRSMERHTAPFSLDLMDELEASREGSRSRSASPDLSYVPEPQQMVTPEPEEERLSLPTVQIPERPAKRARMMRIAERVGYAALGGVTAGAMIVGTLIYTAPTFT